MKKNILTCFIIFSSWFANAQYVTIPDSLFVLYLQGIIPGAMNGNQMDTTNPLVTTTTQTININNHGGFTDLYGIQYFSSLTYLGCNHNSTLTYLPSLPSTLQYLDCSFNYSLKNLPPLPNSLTFLDCTIDSLSNLPPLPNSLTHLYCREATLTNLPTLPNSLQVLWCGNQSLTSLPSLPNSLTELQVYGGGAFTSLPALPNSLISLTILLTNITSLPTLPNSLQSLACQQNKLTSLPTLPNTLKGLYCFSNQLTCLPALPNSLTRLDCSSNLLTGLPILPDSLSVLLCGGNNISCFPTFPNSIDSNWYVGMGHWQLNFIISPNPFTCLPNYTDATNALYGSNNSTMPPLCNAGDPNNCAVECAVGINEMVDKTNAINLYPNPASNSITIQSSIELGTITIYNSLGEIVLQTRSKNKEEQIDLNKLPAGIYTVNVRESYYKLVKE